MVFVTASQFVYSTSNGPEIISFQPFCPSNTSIGPSIPLFASMTAYTAFRPAFDAESPFHIVISPVRVTRARCVRPRDADRVHQPVAVESQQRSRPGGRRERDVCSVIPPRSISGAFCPAGSESRTRFRLPQLTLLRTSRCTRRRRRPPARRCYSDGVPLRRR